MFIAPKNEFITSQDPTLHAFFENAIVKENTLAGKGGA